MLEAVLLAVAPDFEKVIVMIVVVSCCSLVVMVVAIEVAQVMELTGQ